MISWKVLGAALIFGGLLGGIRYLFDLLENLISRFHSLTRFSSVASGCRKWRAF